MADKPHTPKSLKYWPPEETDKASGVTFTSTRIHLLAAKDSLAGDRQKTDKTTTLAKPEDACHHDKQGMQREDMPALTRHTL